VINSNLSPILHRLATIHPLHTDKQTDRRQTHRAIDALQLLQGVAHQKLKLISIRTRNFMK